MRLLLETISPARASALLAGNTDNRSIRMAKVRNFARQMKSGAWLTTHQGIAIAPSGRLLDGQHRLMGVVEAGVAVSMWVAYDADEATFKAIDRGTNRTISDCVNLLTDKESNRMAAAIVTFYVKCNVTGGVSPTVDQVDNEFLDKSEAYIAVTELVRGVGKRCGLRRAAIGAALAGYIHKDKVKGMAFADAVMSGANLSLGMPAYMLREAALQGRMKSDYEHYWKTAAAAKADYEGRQLLVLQAATVDLLGNTYDRLASKRREEYAEGLKTRKSKKDSA